MHVLAWTAATLRMVERFLRNSGNEAVGLTMLGKTAEVCVDKVLLHGLMCLLHVLLCTAV